MIIISTYYLPGFIELFHLNWIYAFKSEPRKVALWTQRLLQHRETWEKIEQHFLQTYGKDPLAREAWLQSTSERKVNEILALVYGIQVYHQFQEGKLSPEFESEYRELTSHFRHPHEWKLTEKMQAEFAAIQPIEALLKTIPGFDSLQKEIMSERLYIIKNYDASSTEEDIPWCDLMEYEKFVAQARASVKKDLTKEDKEEIQAAVSDMKDQLEELVDEMVSEAEGELDDELETDIDNDQAQHNIKKLTIQAITRYLKSGTRDPQFEEMLNLLAQDLKNKVFTKDSESIESIKKLLNRPDVKSKLKTIFDKATTELPDSSDWHEMTDGLSAGTLDYLAQIEAELNKHEEGHQHGEDHHHHGDGHHHDGGGFGIQHLGLFLAVIGFLWFLATGELQSLIDGGFPFAFAMAGIGGLGLGGLFGQEEETPEEIVARYTINLTEMAQEGKFDDAGYLEKEALAIDRQIGVTKKNNVVLVGDPVVGESLVEAIVTRMAQGKSKTDNLNDVTFLEFNTTQFIDELTYPGKFEQKIRDLILAIQATKKTKKVVLVLNFQDIYRVGALTLKPDMMRNLHFRFKEAINDPDISILGVANENVYEGYFENNEKLKDAFGVVELKVPPPYKLDSILRDYKKRIPSLYGDLLPKGVKFKITTKVLKEAVKLCQKYDPSGTLPNKVQEIIDRIIIQKLGKTRELQLQLQHVEIKCERAVQKLVEAEEKGNELTANHLDQILLKLIQEKERLTREKEEHQAFLEEVKSKKKWAITLEDIALQIAKETGIPIYELQEDEEEKLAKYPEEMKKRIVGQNHAVDQTFQGFFNSSGKAKSKKGKTDRGLFICGAYRCGENRIGSFYGVAAFWF